MCCLIFGVLNAVNFGFILEKKTSHCAPDKVLTFASRSILFFIDSPTFLSSTLFQMLWCHSCAACTNAPLQPVLYSSSLHTRTQRECENHDQYTINSIVTFRVSHKHTQIGRHTHSGLLYTDSMIRTVKNLTMWFVSETHADFCSVRYAHA